MLFPHHADKSAEVPKAEVKSNKKKDKAAKKEKVVVEAKSDVGDELELAEEAFFHGKFLFLRLGVSYKNERFGLLICFFLHCNSRRKG
jgi:hypothetical protein